MNFNKSNFLKIAFLLSFTLLALFENIKGQSFQNLAFEQLCDTSKTSFCHWDISWEYKSKIFKKRDTNNNGSLLIEGENDSSISFVEQSQQINSSSKLKIISFSGKIKTENVVGKGAGLSISILDQQGNYLFTQHMGNGAINGVSGTHAWKNFTLQAVCDTNAYTVRIGAIFYGKGKAWFDDFHFNAEFIEDRHPNEIAQKYIDHTCNIIGKHSLVKDSIDLPTLKTNALNIAGQAKNYSDCHLAIQYLISSLGDHHSFLMKPEAVSKWQEGGEGVNSAKKITFATHEMKENFGYLSIPGFHSNDRNYKIIFADSIQNALSYFDQKGVKGWIIDLRKNDGGNMEPMLAGLGPLFDSEVLGFLVNVDGEKEAWGYKNGSPFSGNESGESPTFPIELKNKSLPIAVLTNSATGSSGEIIVISFIGNKNTKSFGAPTWGISTGNGEFELLDGAKLFLTSTIMADRSGKIYGGKIDPDFLIEESKEGTDLTLEEAIKWLEKQLD